METQGGPFGVPDLWRKSAFTLPDAAETTLFSDIKTEISLISNDFDQELRLPGIEDYQFGQLEDILPPETADREESVSEDGPTESDALDDDVWNLDVNVAEGGELRTWEAFLDESHSESRITYISEAGPGAFDALQGDSSNVLQPAFFLKCLAMLGLGRSSALFKWNAKDGRFLPTLDDIRLSGFSLVSSTSLVEQLSHVGTQFNELRAFVDKTYAARRPLAARIALATCVQVILEALDQNLAEHVSTTPTALQLLAHFEIPGQVITELCALVHATSKGDTDVVFLGLVREKIEQLGVECSPYHRIHLDILHCVSRPWVHRVCRNTGLMHGEFDMSTDSDFADTTERTGLVSHEDEQSIAEITTGLAILRDASPDHPLLLPTSWGIAQPEVNMTSMQVDVDAVLDKAEQYQRSLLHAIDLYDQGSQKPSQIPTQEQDREDTLEQMPWQDDEHQREYFELVGNQFSQPPLQSLDAFPAGLRSTVNLVMQEKSLDQEDAFDLHSEEVSPLQHLQPYLRVQSRLVNGSILRLLFRRFDIRKHLTLQHAFHLFGNGVFVHRLTNALFSSESHSAERKRGQVIGGVDLGLRLDSRETRRWPPASSELRLGLMGVLTDAWASPEELPGGLSFSIRELEDAEIEKVLDPHSIFALDFLRLRYEAPAPLDVILTPDSMSKYDDVFRVLLRILRMLHVVTLLRRRATTSTSIPAMHAFAHEAHHAVTALSSYMFDTGITVPWQHFNSRLDTLEQDLAREDSLANGYGSRVRIGIQGLRTLHDEMLDTMRARLMLRTRHAKLRDTTNQILETILGVHKMTVEDGNAISETEVWKSRDKLREQTKELLRQLSDLGRKLAKRGSGMGEQDREDAVAAEMLRFRLDPAAGSDIQI